MKVGALSLEEEMGISQEKNRTAYSRVEGVVDHMIELYEQAEKSIRTGKNHQEVIQGLNQQLLTLRPLKTVREHFVHYYRKLSNLVRRLQNGTRKDTLNLSRYSKRRESNGNNSDQNRQLNIERFNKFFDKFITRQDEQAALQILITEHFLREGRWECAKVWQKQVEQIDPNKLFTECYKLRSRIKHAEFEEAIQWCQSEKLFQTKANLLEYELIKAQIISLLERGNPKLALEHFSKRFRKFQPLCEEQIQKLMGYVLFKEQTFWGQKIKGMTELYIYCSNRYSEFVFTPQKCERLADAFMKEYLKQNNMSHFDVLKIVYGSSKKISEEYQRLMTITWQGEGKEQKESKYDSILPFSIRLDKEYQYHSLFLCPVTKEVHSSGESSVLLSCGHLISQTAQERIILESRNRRRVKCPICQKQIKPQDSIEVQF